MIFPMPPFGFIPAMLLKQDPWVAREGDVPSQHLLLPCIRAWAGI